VAGDTCEAELNPAVGLELVDVVLELEISNASAPLPKKPLDFDDDDDADEASDWMASRAVDAAPKANSMAELPLAPPERLILPTPIQSANTMPMQKALKNWAFSYAAGSKPRQEMP
jgi:hypothetical protein